ncbi:methyltransferase domain-containing protein [Nonomuraea phyllanthi]|uniref:methyltransferase domain-containing protein n=1 Tax=Nonomuraea phyllanthi TaxID=2219224 RepID=UPI0012930A3B|nr:methyltransferase domain-containing protein [Nonomuraea phyllanthi]QFY09625.1 methyltransferase domain-containing protein [Nonomuraea phyllanthi]
MSNDIAEQFDTGGWRFTADVAEVFDDHVRASVPHYDVIQDLVAETTDWLVPAGGLVADLGASTGASARRILQRHPTRDIRMVLYDQQPAMLDQAAAELSKLDGEHDVTLSATRIQYGPLVHENADLTLALFTLQFLPQEERVTALRLARECSAQSGALIVAEKIRAVDSRWAEIGNDVAHDYKAAHGITDAAIRAKARALRGVLRPYPQQTTMQAMADAGWHAPEVLFRWHSWAVIGAFASAQ